MSAELQLTFENRTATDNVYAHFLGLDMNQNGKLFFLHTDGSTLYYPVSPANPGTPLAVDVAILIGGPGQSKTVTIPTYFDSARMYFSIGKPLTFYLNPGPAAVHPSFTSITDVNYSTHFTFSEISFNSNQAFANISYVDMVSLPVSLTLNIQDGPTQRVEGLPEGGMELVANDIVKLGQKDWAALTRQDTTGALLRVLNPTKAITDSPTLFQGYYTDYVNSVWSKYSKEDLTVNTQGQWGDVKGRVDATGNLVFTYGADTESFSKPTAYDIFSCASGPFTPAAPGSMRGAIIARLGAGFNRSTLLSSDITPNGSNPLQYYLAPPTNEFSKIVHARNPDGLGYAFPFDDVTPSGGRDLSGAVQGKPKNMVVGIGAHSTGAGAKEGATGGAKEGGTGGTTGEPTPARKHNVKR